MTFILNYTTPSPLVNDWQPLNPMQSTMFILIERVLRDTMRNPFMMFRAAKDIRGVGQANHPIEARIPIFWKVCFQIAKQIPAMHEAQAKLAQFVFEVTSAVVGDWNDPERFVDPYSHHMFFSETTPRSCESEERVLNLCSFLAELCPKKIFTSFTDSYIIPCINLVHARTPAGMVYNLLNPANNFRPTVPHGPEERLWRLKYHISRLWLHIHAKELFARLADGLPPPEQSNWMPPPLRPLGEDEWKHVWGMWESQFWHLEMKLVDANMQDAANDALTRLRLVRETREEEMKAEKEKAEQAERSSPELIFNLQLD